MPSHEKQNNTDSKSSIDTHRENTERNNIGVIVKRVAEDIKQTGEKVIDSTQKEVKSVINKGEEMLDKAKGMVSAGVKELENDGKDIMKKAKEDIESGLKSIEKFTEKELSILEKKNMDEARRTIESME